MWAIFKVFIKVVTTASYFVFIFGLKAHGILAPGPGMEPTPPSPTTGLPGKSVLNQSYRQISALCC